MRKYLLLIMIIVLTMLSIVVMGCEEEKAESAEQEELPIEELSIEEKLVGEWSNNEVSFIFNEDGSMVMILRDSFVISGEDKRECLWEIDTNYDPIHLDIILIKHEEKLVTQAILRFLTDDRIQICSTEAFERPSSFFDAGEENTLILNRQ